MTLIYIKHMNVYTYTCIYIYTYIYIYIHIIITMICYITLYVVLLYVIRRWASAASGGSQDARSRRGLDGDSHKAPPPNTKKW